MNSDKLKTWVSIFSTIATPIVIAIVGQWIQSSISQDGLKKDYVQMATNILNSPESNKNVELRQWAVNIIDKNSPIPFSQASKENLIQGGMLFVKFPEELVEECSDLPELKGGTGKDVMTWSLDVIHQYKICQLRHHYTIEAIKGMESINHKQQTVACIFVNRVRGCATHATCGQHKQAQVGSRPNKTVKFYEMLGLQPNLHFAVPHIKYSLILAPHQKFSE